MTSQLLILCVTRDRPALVRQCAESFRATQPKHSRLIVVCPAEQRELYSDMPVEVFHHPFSGVTGVTSPANHAVREFIDSADCISIIGDDHRFVSMDWETQVLAAWKEHQIVQTNDGFAGARLGGTTFVDSRIVRSLGWIFPPGLKHLYVDNFQVELARELNCGFYLKDCRIEHLHPFAGKRDMDALTGMVNSAEYQKHDRAEYLRYMREQFRHDVQKVRKALRLNWCVPKPYFEVKEDGHLQFDMTAMQHFSVFIGAPAFGGNVNGFWHVAVSNLVNALGRYGIPTMEKIVMRESDISRARNCITAAFLASPCTHLLWFDTDEDVAPNDTLAMLAANLPLVAAPVPNKSLTASYGINRKPGVNRWHNEAMEVEEVGCGLMLVRREVLEAIYEQGLAESLDGTPERLTNEELPYYRMYYHPSVVDRHYKSEDFTFCRKASAVGYPVCLWPFAKVAHVGMHVFKDETDTIRRMCEAS